MEIMSTCSWPSQAVKYLLFCSVQIGLNPATAEMVGTTLLLSRQSRTHIALLENAGGCKN